MQKAAPTKRRFTPKAQVKPDPAALEAPPPAAAASESSSGGGKGGKGKGGQRQGGGGRGRGGKGGKGGRGRGERFVVPTGQAFFTGGSGALPVASSSASGSYHIGGHSNANSSTGIKTEKNQGSDIKTSEDEEHKDIKVDNDLSNEEKMSQDMEQDAPDLPQMEWPPQDFDPLEPVELPFGPRYLSKRVELAERSIFADPDDAAAMEREENESMFLLQLPSSIAQGSFVPPDDVHAAGGAEEPKPRRQLKPGKLGKIQITQSGRVYLVVNDDLEEGDEKSNNEDDQSGSGPAAPRVKRYEINRGITPSFMQVVASITTKTTSPTSTEEAPSSTPQQLPLRDELHLLGSVTDKIVATPDFDIGERASSSIPRAVLVDSDDEHEGSTIMDTFQDETAKSMKIKSEVS